MTSTPERLGVPGGTRGRRAVLVLLCLAQAMLIVDVVVVNVALPSIRADLAVPDGRIQLVSIGYTLTFGSLLIVFGRAGDLFGRRRLFLIGLAVFTLTSLATGLAQSEGQLIAARAGQGVGAAMVAPTALALLTTAFAEGPSRTKALGYWAAVGSAGAIGGQLVGGVVTDLFGWRWIFLINVPLGCAALVAARRYLTESVAERGATVNARGAVLLSTGLACSILALTRFAEGGHAVQGGVLAGTALLAWAAFAVTERRHATPVLDRRLLRTGSVARANILLAVNAGTLGATLFFTTLYLQVVLGYSPMEVGLAFAPITLLILLISPRAAALVTRYGTRPPLAAGFVLLVLGTALLARMPDDGTYLRDVLGPFVLLAAGSGLSYAPTFVAGTAGVPASGQGLASGFLNSAQELGAAVGLAVLGALAAARTTAPGDLTSGYRVGLLAGAAALVLCLPLIRALPGATPQPDGPVNADDPAPKAP
ncbi:MFS transporter [Actinocorallia sp. A-T 12471]|uniref:MFS transporter n=1 Tax=Actinocorallia sp. A-T 12471 TaxID=3089813 RepID=UPI0029CF4034|nr:MFS transporter [Actinocorallia sp. A-T 12471]MDX6740679.1 MFS transporter [Actinocorallia sp. A-T 12471]